MQLDNRLIYSGSFSPLHCQHIYNMLYCEDLFPKMGNCLFEISQINCRKGFVDIGEIEIRSQAIKSIGRDVMITNASSFCEKFSLFDNSIFIVGTDTFEYLMNVETSWFSFARLLEDFFKNKRRENSFIVLPRDKNIEQWNQLMSYTRQFLANCDVPQSAVGFVNYQTYIQNTISSTAIRSQN